jgi:hypothetical protein
MELPAGAIQSGTDRTAALRSRVAGSPYDQDGVYDRVAARHPEVSVIVPPRSGAVASETASSACTMRDRHLQMVAKRGRMSWQNASGYN